MENKVADPYQGDEETYQVHFRKTFITENQKEGESKECWSLHDMMIPAGKQAKLIRIPNIDDQDFRVSEVCDRLKFNNPTPVIILGGAMTGRAGKTLAGIARAAVRADATIIDSGLGSGIEKFCIRKNLTLIGVAPDQEIIYPRIIINPNDKKDNELTNGHTHFVLLGGADETQTSMKEQKVYDYYWGDEGAVKFDLAKRIAAGRPKKAGFPPCKIVMVLVGDN